MSEIMEKITTTDSVEDEEGADRIQEAKNRVKEIKTSTSELASLLTLAYDQQDWKTLGYKNFADYCFGEFGYGKGRAYQLLHLGALTDRLRKVIDLPNDFTIQEKDARLLTNDIRGGFIQGIADRATDDIHKNAGVVNSAFTKLIADRNASKKASKKSSKKSSSKAVSNSTPDKVSPMKSAGLGFGEKPKKATAEAVNVVFTTIQNGIGTLPKPEQLAENPNLAQYVALSLGKMARQINVIASTYQKVSLQASVKEAR